MAGLTPVSTPLLSPGGYTANTPTRSAHPLALQPQRITPSREVGGPRQAHQFRGKRVSAASQPSSLRLAQRVVIPPGG